MINFAEVEETVKVLNQTFAENKISEKALEERLLQLIDVAEDDYYWMFGHRSGRWFRHDGEEWVLDDPKKAFSRGSDGAVESTSELAQNEGAEADWESIVLGIIIIMALGMVVYANSGYASL
jgi:hypothetical protein